MAEKRKPKPKSRKAAPAAAPRPPRHPRDEAKRPRAGEEPQPFGVYKKPDRLLEAIKAKLLEPSDRVGADTRLEAAADAYVSAMESGSYVHHKEILDREEGKVPTKLANADGSNLKAYVGLPVDGEDAP